MTIVLHSEKEENVHSGMIVACVALWVVVLSLWRPYEAKDFV